MLRVCCFLLLFFAATVEAEQAPVTPRLLARFDVSTSQVRHLFLYCREELQTVHVWLGDAWLPTVKARDASEEAPYFAYRVVAPFIPQDGQGVLVSGWTTDRDTIYGYHLTVEASEDGLRIRSDAANARSQAQYDDDKANARDPFEGLTPRTPLAETSRALIAAVRKTGAKSVTGQLDAELVAMAQKYADRMARQGRQDGHAGWDGRFRYLQAQGGGGRVPSEITAESWSHLGESLQAHADSCVESWMHSPGHKADMMRYHGRYGYAMARSKRGVYYAVGIFAN